MTAWPKLPVSTVKKGGPIYVEGRLKYGKYTDQSGVEKSTVDIVATELQLLGGREGMGGPSDGGDEGGAPPPPPDGASPARCRTGACAPSGPLHRARPAALMTWTTNLFRSDSFSAPPGLSRPVWFRA